ncbi:MAG: efflux RND transporter periplasmic adaptor subunit [Burkholderiaceae bacterium]
MLKPDSVRLWPAALVISGCLTLAACDRLDVQASQDGPARADETAASQPVKTVLAEQVANDPFLDGRRFVGQLLPVSTVDLSFRVSGELTRLPVKPGRVVPKGELIAALDQRQFNLGLRQAAAQLKLARSDRDRQRRLIGSAASQASVDRADAEFRVRMVAMESAQLSKQYARIEAPFDALIAQRLVYQHTNVQANTPVVRVQDVTELRVEIALPQDLIGLLSTPEAFEVSGIIGERDDLSVPLEYREHSIQTNQVGRTYRVVFGVAQPIVSGLLPGMTATVLIKPKDQSRQATLSVPVGAINPVSNEQFQVWVIAPKTNTVQARRVQLGVAYGDRVPVIAGLEPGERIVTAGVHLLREDMKVDPIKAR